MARALEPEIGRRDRPRAEGGRLPLREPRSAGLPHGQPERRAAPAARVSPDRTRAHGSTTLAMSAAVAAVRFSATLSTYRAGSAPLLASRFSRSTSRTCPRRSKISTRSTSRSACAHFDVAHHQPHPPGYPLFIAARQGGARARAVARPRRSALVSVVAGALGVLAMVALFRRLDGDDRPARWSVAASPWRDGAAVLVHGGAAAERRRRAGRRARGAGADASAPRTRSGARRRAAFCAGACRPACGRRWCG